MAKRKAQSSESEDEAQYSDASSEPKSKSKPLTKKTATEKVKPGQSAGSESSTAGKTNKRSVGPVQKSSEGDKYIDLGKKKRATVRSFKDIPLLDIREFYGAGSDEKPGKKGISLTLEQWQVLKTNADTIDQLFSELSKAKK